MERTITRGDMYYANLTPVVGSEQDGYRPVVVIQNDFGNKYSPTIVVAAITSRSIKKVNLPTHIRLSPEYGLEKNSVVLLEQIRTIDRKRLGGYIGMLNENAISQIDHALLVSVGLNKYPIHKLETNKDALVLCLCHACARQFYSLPDHNVMRLDYNQEIKDKCDYCSVKLGFDFVITHSKKGEAKVL